jgi:hypothetical protein
MLLEKNLNTVNLYKKAFFKLPHAPIAKRGAQEDQRHANFGT